MRIPSETRPLSLGNCDNKIVSDCMAVPLTQACEGVLLRFQRAAFKARHMADNIIEIETFAMPFSLCGGAFPLLSRCAYKAAFPSIIHEFLWMVLLAMGVSIPFVNGLKNLYKDCWQRILAGRQGFRWMLCLRGVKQGCPISMILFAAGIDVFMRMFLNQIPPSVSRIRAYADDLAIIISNCIPLLDNI